MRFFCNFLHRFCRAAFSGIFITLTNIGYAQVNEYPAGFRWWHLVFETVKGCDENNQRVKHHAEDESFAFVFLFSSGYLFHHNKF